MFFAGCDIRPRMADRAAPTAPLRCAHRLSRTSVGARFDGLAGFRRLGPKRPARRYGPFRLGVILPPHNLGAAAAPHPLLSPLPPPSHPPLKRSSPLPPASI